MHGIKNIPVIIALLAIIIPILAAVTYAGVRLVVPDEDPYAPIYADFYGNEEWVAFFFYRDPDCVPDDFDLYFEFFDYSGYAFTCDLTVKGFVIYETPGDFVPKQAKLKGLGEVPVWFVSPSDFQTAINAGSLAKQSSATTPTSVPPVYQLDQNYPNPINPETTISHMRAGCRQ